MEWTTVEGPSPVYTMAREFFMERVVSAGTPVDYKEESRKALMWSIEFHRQ